MDPDSVLVTLELQSPLALLFPFPDDDDDDDDDNDNDNDNDHRLGRGCDMIYRYFPGDQDHFDIYTPSGDAMDSDDAERERPAQ